MTSESNSVTSFRLAATDGEALPAALPGQFVTLRLESPDVERPIARSYSLSGRPGDAEYRISVKREVHGRASGYLHTRLHAGDTVPVAAPRGAFTLAAGEAPLVLVSGGVGVTPVLAMLHELAAARSTRKIWWLYSTRNRAEHPFAAEVRELLSHLPNAAAHICYTRPGPDDGSSDYNTAGRLSAEVLRTLEVPRDVDVYLCGPSAFMADITTALIDIGVDAAHIHTEAFGTVGSLNPGVVDSVGRPPHPPADEVGNGPTVSFARSDLTVHWSTAYTSLLELAEACDVPSRWSCRTGVCHTCETGLLSGSVTFSPEPIDAPPPGNVLTCCAQPRDDLVLDL